MRKDTRWTRRERKLRRRRYGMRVSGRSVFTIIRASADKRRKKGRK